MNSSAEPATTARYLLRFESLFNAGRAYCFPCDAQGQVALDRLSERGRNNYLFARAAVGRDLAQPKVVRDACKSTVDCDVPVSCGRP